MIHAKPIIPQRIRNIRQCTFGWVDHNFLHCGFLKSLSQHELLLYYFLITVADRNGVSFYDYEKICQYLKMETDEYVHARDRLDEISLITSQDGVFQVLSLPDSISEKKSFTRSINGDYQSLKTIFKNIT